MRVLVTTASKYGSTHEIGEAVAEALRDSGLEVDFAPNDEAESPETYDAVVIGSGVYAGRWLRAAKDYVAEHEKALGAVPVWLLSSGPVGDPPKPTEDPVDVTDLVARTAAREHRLFPGKLDRSRLRFADKAIVAALRAPEGDFRDFGEISEWATNVAESLGKAARS